MARVAAVWARAGRIAGVGFSFLYARPDVGIVKSATMPVSWAPLDA